MGDEQMLMEDEWEQYAKKRDAEVDALRAERDAALAEAEELRDSLKTSEAVRETYRMAILGMDAERDALRAELAAIPWAALRSVIERALRYRSQEWVTVWQWLRAHAPQPQEPQP